MTDALPELCGFYGMPLDALRMPLERVCAWLVGAQRRERYEARKSAIQAAYGIAPHAGERFSALRFASGVAATELPEHGLSMIPYELDDPPDPLDEE